MIPQIIHYCWVGKKELPPDFKKYISGWKKKCPNWLIKEWNEANIPIDVPYVKKAYDNGLFSNVSNFVRLYAIYNEGGIYLDADVELLKTLDFFKNESCFFTFQDNFKSSDAINNAVCGAVKSHTFIKKMLGELQKKFDGSEPSNLSGPGLTTAMLKKKGLKNVGNVDRDPIMIDKITIFPKRYFHPYRWDEKFNKNCIKSDTCGIHHWAMSWARSNNKRIIIKNLTKDFKIGFIRRQSALQRFISLFSGIDKKRTIRVLDNVSLGAAGGEILGIIGANGSGKSTLLRLVAGILEKDSGQIYTNGKIVPLINLYAGLKERLTMKDNIFLIASFFGMARREVEKRFDIIIEFSGLSQFLDTKIYQFSEGMKQRLVFSIAAHCNPDILLLDEVFEVGDEDFRKKSSSKILELVKRGACVVLVSHNLQIIRKVCKRVILLESGQIKKEGNAEDIITGYV